jgi:hypothetical protein
MRTLTLEDGEDSETGSSDAFRRGVVTMGVNPTRNALVVETVKGDDHFVLVYPNTTAGRSAAHEAVRTWLLDCELDFNRQDAESFWRAIDARRFHAGFERRVEGGMQWNRTRRT